MTPSVFINTDFLQKLLSTTTFSVPLYVLLKIVSFANICQINCSASKPLFERPKIPFPSRFSYNFLNSYFFPHLCTHPHLPLMWDKVLILENIFVLFAEHVKLRFVSRFQYVVCRLLTRFLVGPRSNICICHLTLGNCQMQT